MSRHTLGACCKDRGRPALWLLSASSFPSGMVLAPIPSLAPNGLSLERDTTIGAISSVAHPDEQVADG